MTTIIDGKAFADSLCDTIASETQELIKKGITPGLAVVIVGEDPASTVYVNNKRKKAKDVGFYSVHHNLPEDTSQEELITLIQELNADDSVHGILVQLPVPQHIDDKAVINTIISEKDVDGFTQMNVGRLMIGEDCLVPCTPLGCTMLLKEHFGGDLSGKNAVIVGRSNIVGKPMASLLLKENATVTIVHSHTKNIESVCQAADILIAAVGKPQLIKKSWVNSNTVVIDVGINRIEDNGKKRLVGDVDFDDLNGFVQAITPVPGGVGPMTIACLLHNTMIAAKKSHNIH